MSNEIDSYIKGPAPSRTPESQYTYLEQQLTAVERAFNRQKQAIVEASENAQALYDNEVIVRATADSALVQTIETLDAKVDLNNTTTQATITNIQTAFADSESATASKFTSLESKVDAADSENRALIVEEIKTRATKVDALSSKVSSLEAAVKTNASDSRSLIIQEAKARADADSSEATIRQNLQAFVGYSSGQTYSKTLASQVTEEVTARAEADKTLAQKLTTLSSGTSRVLTQDDMPSSTGRIVGDVWYDTDDNFRPYVWAPSEPGLTNNQWRDNSNGNFTSYIGQLATITNKINTLSTNDIVMAGTQTTLSAKLSNVDQGIGVQYTVASKGFSATTSEAPGLFVNSGAASENTVARSYNLWVINRSTGLITSFASYDVYGSTSEATTLANALNALTNTSIVVVATFDEPQTNRLFGSLPAAMYRCGASRSIFGSSEFKSRSAYLLVGIPGEGEGSGVEKYSGNVDSSASAYSSYSFTIKNSRVEGLSGLGLASVTLNQLSTVVADPVNGLAYQWAVNGSVGTDSAGASALILSGGKKANGSGGWTDYSRIVMSANSIEMNGSVIINGTLTGTKIATGNDGVSNSNIVNNAVSNSAFARGSNTPSGAVTVSINLRAGARVSILVTYDGGDGLGFNTTTGTLRALVNTASFSNNTATIRPSGAGIGVTQAFVSGVLVLTSAFQQYVSGSTTLLTYYTAPSAGVYTISADASSDFNSTVNLLVMELSK